MRNGKLYWPETYLKKTYKDEIDMHYDVVVIGGGMSGALTAYRVAEAGYHTLLVDKAEIGGASSAANTGLMQYMSDKLLHECVKDFGALEAYHFYKASKEGLEDIEQLSHKLDARVNFIKRDSLFIASTKRDKKTIKDEYEALRYFDFPVDYVKQEQLKEDYGIDKYNALITHEDAEINPYVFVNEIVKYAHDHFHLDVLEHTELIKYKAGNKNVGCQFNNQTVTTDKLVMTTGYAKNKITRRYINREEFVASYAVVTEPIHENQFWKDKAMIWESARPYLYIRHVPGNRVLIGGLDEKTDKIPDEKHIQKQGKRLIKAFNKLYPELELTIEYAYGARFGETKDGKPFIGKVEGDAEIYGLYGYGGNGTVYSSFGSKLLLDMIEGKYNPLSELFKVKR
ncbi:NAD(P)/FAD-dependent oxidoreductase [Macrococcus capreoli]|uniref:NAD(P)/FAD-dependent oxidoreductase n=1 Tax=Macrococcus capreoli TaxID=2982690 RepID=UPI003EE48F1D